jgi:hypothetical protein
VNIEFTGFFYPFYVGFQKKARMVKKRFWGRKRREDPIACCYFGMNILDQVEMTVDDRNIGMNYQWG